MKEAIRRRLQRDRDRGVSYLDDFEGGSIRAIPQRNGGYLLETPNKKAKQ